MNAIEVFKIKLDSRLPETDTGYDLRFCLSDYDFGYSSDEGVCLAPESYMAGDSLELVSCLHEPDKDWLN